MTPSGGWGNGAPTTLADLAMLRRAINDDWPVPPDVKRAIIEELGNDIESPRLRRVLSVARSFIAMDRATIRYLEEAIRAVG